ncbi:MAG: NUDIX domain-containing protein [Chloroflexi bacterium]|nr:NUDIX domain-containing protein [Chloroflexota bacterium]
MVAGTVSVPDGWQLQSLQAEAVAAGRACVVSAIIVNDEGRAFVQRRSLARRLFPNCWDIAGGHVDSGETLETALAREIRQETGWTLRRLVWLIAVNDWAVDIQEQVVLKREFTFLVEVTGDMSAPRLETEKFSEWRWIGPDEVLLLTEHRQEGDTLIRDLVQAGLSSTNEPASPAPATERQR